MNAHTLLFSLLVLALTSLSVGAQAPAQMFNAPSNAPASPATPPFKPSVTSSGASVRVDSATLTANCGISSQTGTWLTPFSDTDTSTGCTYTIATGEFSSPPACTCSAVFNGFADQWCAFVASPSQTSVILYTRSQNGVGSPAPTTLICVGPH
jgi:hypothetical protein